MEDGRILSKIFESPSVREFNGIRNDKMAFTWRANKIGGIDRSAERIADLLIPILR